MTPSELRQAAQASSAAQKAAEDPPPAASVETACTSGRRQFFETLAVNERLASASPKSPPSRTASPTAADASEESFGDRLSRFKGLSLDKKKLQQDREAAQAASKVNQRKNMFEVMARAGSGSVSPAARKPQTVDTMFGKMEVGPKKGASPKAPGAHTFAGPAKARALTP